jgi:putative membrane protein
MIRERVLVLCVDRDDDLGKKTKITGPLIGKKENLEAAATLMLKDPEETDANAMFQAVKTYDEISKTKEAEVVTITGDARLGYNADKKVADQLERVLQRFPATSCIFVTDGADDDEVIPLIASRVKIDSRRMVVMKQAKELEKTYIVLLNKLREPYYARIIFGVPAILLLSFLASETLGFGWKPILGLLGVYLLLKGFGLEESIGSVVRGLVIPSSRTALIMYLPVFALAIISVSISITEYTKRVNDYPLLEAVSFALKPLLWPFLISMVVLLFLGKIIELYPERRKFEIIDNGMYAASSILVAFVGFMAVSWIIGDAWFTEFLLATFACLVMAAIANELSKVLKTNVAGKMRLENKEVVTEIGAYIGKIIGVDKKNGVARVQTPVGSIVPLKLEEIMNVEDKVIIRR